MSVPMTLNDSVVRVEMVDSVLWEDGLWDSCRLGVPESGNQALLSIQPLLLEPLVQTAIEVGTTAAGGTFSLFVSSSAGVSSIP